MKIFTNRHYIPVLRWKMAERRALAQMLPPDRRFLTPLIELLPRNFVPTKKNPRSDPDLAMRDIVAELFGICGKRPLFIDLLHLTNQPDSPTALRLFSAHARSWGLVAIPVTGIERSPQYQGAMASIVPQSALGISLRIRREDLDDPEVNAKIGRLLSQLRLRPRDVDLIVDLKIVTQADDSAFDLPYSRLAQLADWRTFTILGGAFPKDLQGMRPGQYLLSRLEWRNWNPRSSSSRFPRLPAFGDYTVQHPIFAEPPWNANFSASIRYATEADWIIMRGEGVRNEGGAGYAQWPANAQLLLERPEFCGSNFSAGDRYIAAMAAQSTNTGNARTWIQAGINHHLVFVARQIASLNGLSASAEL